MGNGGELTAIRLIELIKNVARKTARNSSADMVIAEVTSLDPLEVDIGNNTRLTEEFLFLGQMCRPHKVTIPHTHIVDAMLSEKSPSLNSYTNVIAANVPVEVPAVPEPVNYSTYQNNGREDAAENGSVGDWKEGTGEEKQNTVSDLTNGSKVSFSGSAAGAQAPTFSGKLQVDDKKHVHIIGRHTTLDVHFPHGENEECVTLEIYPKLKVGDKVLGFFFNSHQRLYIAERIEEADE